MAIPLRFDGGATAMAAGLRCWRQNCGASDVPLQGWRCYCGATAVLLRCCCGGAAAAVGGSMTSARRLLWDVVFGRITVFAAAVYYCFYHLVMPPKLATTGRTDGLGKANKKTPTPTRRLHCGGTAVTKVLLRSLYGVSAVLARCLSGQCGHGGAAAILLRIGPTRGGTAEVLNMFKVSAVPPRRSAVLTVFRRATAINE